MIKNLTITANNLIDIYLDYKNNYLTVALMAEHNEMSEAFLKRLIDLGRQLYKDGEGVDDK